MNLLKSFIFFKRQCDQLSQFTKKGAFQSFIELAIELFYIFNLTCIKNVVFINFFSLHQEHAMTDSHSTQKFIFYDVCFIEIVITWLTTQC